MSTQRTLDRHAPIAWAGRFARTTPGAVAVIAVVVAVGCVIAGLVSGGQLDGRIAEHTAVLDRSEPVAYAAQNLYAALSEADAAAATAFLSGTESSPVRATYQQALADAASALADVSAGATDADTRTAVAQITAELAAYTGLVEAARANSRQGFPVGSAYLRDASSLMQDTLLPGAEKIYAGDLAALERGQQAVGSTPVVSLVLLVLVLAAIAAGSVILRRRTNRQFNVGLVVAAVLVLLAIGWTVGATRLAADSIEQSRNDGTARFEELAQARILAQQARTDETLQLIERGDITAGEQSFQDRVQKLNELLGAQPSATSDAAARWADSHREQVGAYQAGDYPAAVAQAIGSGPDESAAQFALVESSLRDEIEQTRTTLRDHVSAAGAFLAWSPTGTLVLMVFAAVAAVVGLWPRLKEFL